MGGAPRGGMHKEKVVNLARCPPVPLTGTLPVGVQHAAVRIHVGGRAEYSCRRALGMQAAKTNVIALRLRFLLSLLVSPPSVRLSVFETDLIIAPGAY